MGEYIECVDCGFVLRAVKGDEPVPRRVESCPECDGTTFEFTGE
ncbi:hypothetical protein [Halomicrobium urmianum]|nr:hypothetical protein [Halomicrobium urmianum]